MELVIRSTVVVPWHHPPYSYNTGYFLREEDYLEGLDVDGRIISK
jgi:hypothetical protein